MSLVIERKPEAVLPAPGRAPHVAVAPDVESAQWSTALLDQIDYGLVVLDEEARALHVNSTAREWLSRSSAPLRMHEGRLVAVAAQESGPFRRALASAVRCGWRALLAFGEGTQGVAAALGPLQGARCAIPGLALLVIGRVHVCDALTAQMFASRHGLTLAEAHVLDLLCGGLAPGEIAHRQGIAVSTVRSHIRSIRSKTSARSIGTLVREVALLPPLGRARVTVAATANG